MKQLFLLILLSACFIHISNAQDPNPELFQTWYLYSDEVDLGDIYYHYGEDVPQMTINPDLSFTAIDNCWDIAGVFNYLEGDGFYDFLLETVNFEEACILGGGNGFILRLLYENTTPIGGIIENASILQLEYAPGFIFTFKNQITLSIAEQQLQKLTITPIPASDIIQIKNFDGKLDNVEIYAISGSRITSYSNLNSYEINISDLTTGIYFLKISSMNSSTIRKFLKE